MVESIERGKQIKIFRQEVDAEIIARFYFFSIAQIRDKELFPEDQFRTYDVIHSYLDYHVRGIATVEGIHFLENEIYNKKKQ